MVENGTKKDRRNHQPPIYKQTKLPNSWFSSKTEDPPANVSNSFETVLSQLHFEALVNKMDTMEPPNTSNKRPSNSARQQLTKRTRYGNDMLDGKHTSISESNDKVLKSGSLSHDKQLDSTENMKEIGDRKAIVPDPPEACTVHQPIKSLLPFNEKKSSFSDTISIQFKTGHGANKIPIEKTVPRYQDMCRTYIDWAFESVHSEMSTQIIHEIFSYLCRSGVASNVFTVISDSLHGNAEKLCQSLESMASMNINFLTEMVSQWTHYQKILTNIDNVCAELNSRYIYKETNSTCLLDFGRHVYTNLLSRNTKIRKRMILNIIYLIKCERNMTLTDNTIIQSALKLMYENLPTYIPPFEMELITTTRHHYSTRLSTAKPSMTIQNYIVFTLKLILAEPILKQEYRKYFFKTAASPSDIVIGEILLKHIDYIIQEGFNYLIELEQHKLLKTLYIFVSPYDEIADLQTAFGNYVKNEYIKLGEKHKIGDSDYHDRPPSEKTRSSFFVVSLLQLKSRMESIVWSCFDGDAGFRHTLKDSFELGIIRYKASSTQHIACYINDQLESPWPFSPGIIQSLDDGIRLLRSFQVEEIFKSYYKNDVGVRLLQSQSTDVIEKCTYINQRLKLECGDIITKDIDVMINDIQRSQRQAQRFKDEKRLASIEPEDRIDTNAFILTGESWSLGSCSQRIKLPRQMQEHRQKYLMFYKEENPRRKLDWLPSLGTCVIEAAFPRCRLQLVTTELQSIILLLFNDINCGSLSLKQICKQTRIDKTHAMKALDKLSCQKTPILIKRPHNSSHGGTTNTLYTFSYNMEFNTTLQTIDLQDISAELVPSTLKVMYQQELFTQGEKIQSMIMKILKNHRHLSIEKLYQLNQAKFPLDPLAIKTQLGYLVKRGFISHNTEDGEYAYCE